VPRRWGRAGGLCRQLAAGLERVADNAARNRLAERVQGRHGDAFEVLRALRDEDARFDTVLLDPPAFIKRRKDEKEGVQAYLRLNRLGMELLEPGGLLVTSSCSFHMGRDAFVRTVQQAARRAGRYPAAAGDRSAGAGPSGASGDPGDRLSQDALLPRASRILIGEFRGGLGISDRKIAKQDGVLS
jgi:hypothetical protein